MNQHSRLPLLLKPPISRKYPEDYPCPLLSTKGQMHQPKNGSAGDIVLRRTWPGEGLLLGKPFRSHKVGFCLLGTYLRPPSEGNYFRLGHLLISPSCLYQLKAPHPVRGHIKACLSDILLFSPLCAPFCVPLYAPMALAGWCLTVLSHCQLTGDSARLLPGT